jgi:hypothetical protein
MYVTPRDRCLTAEIELVNQMEIDVEGILDLEDQSTQR